MCKKCQAFFGCGCKCTSNDVKIASTSKKGKVLGACTACKHRLVYWISHCNRQSSTKRDHLGNWKWVNEEGQEHLFREKRLVTQASVSLERSGFLLIGKVMGLMWKGIVQRLSRELQPRKEDGTKDQNGSPQLKNQRWFLKRGSEVFDCSPCLNIEFLTLIHFLQDNLSVFLIKS